MRRRYWHRLAENDTALPRELFLKGRVRRRNVATYMQELMCPSSDALADDILNRLIFRRLPVFAPKDPHCNVTELL